MDKRLIRNLLLELSGLIHECLQSDNDTLHNRRTCVTYSFVLADLFEKHRSVTFMRLYSTIAFYRSIPATDMLLLKLPTCLLHAIRE